MIVNYLDEDTFRKTYVQPIQRLGEDCAPPFEFWSYVDAIPESDFQSFDCSKGQVDWVYQLGDQFQHVLINSTTRNVYMVIVLDLANSLVSGHRIVNLNELYGLDTPPAD